MRFAASQSRVGQPGFLEEVGSTGKILERASARAHMDSGKELIVVKKHLAGARLLGCRVGFHTLHSAFGWSGKAAFRTTAIEFSRHVFSAYLGDAGFPVKISGYLSSFLSPLPDKWRHVIFAVHANCTCVIASQ